MPELTTDAVHALIRALMPTLLPSAVEDVSNRIVKDQPNDMVVYAQTLQKELPHCFAPATPVDAAPTADQPGYNQYALDHLEQLAGQPAAPASSSTSATPPPASVAKDDPASFIAHVEAIAAGRTQVV